MLMVVFVAATTIRFQINSPQMDGGLPLRSYVVQYKPLHENWNEALNRTWAIGNIEGLIRKFKEMSVVVENSII